MNDGEMTGTMNAPGDSSARWEIPRADVRLWLTFALGLVGVALFPGRLDFVPNPFAGVWGVAIGGSIWGIAALLSIVFLRRVEGTKLAWRFSPWFFLRGIAVALASPLLLFAARPVRRDSSSRFDSISRFGFAAFPLLLATGFTLVSFGDMLPRDLRWLSLGWFSFSVWAWLGCALLSLFSPWPDAIGIPSQQKLATSEKAGSILSLVVLAVILAIVVLGGKIGYLLIAFFILPTTLLWCGLLYMIVPWLAPLLFPKLISLPDERRAGTLGTVAFFAVALVPMIGAASVDENLPFLYVLSGKLFSSTFAGHVGGALDQPSITKWLFLATIFSLNCLTYVSIARWASDRKSLTEYWCFAVPAVLMCLYSMTVLTLPFWWLMQYVDAMGFTPKRIYGITYCLIVYASLLSFFAWALWKPARSSIDIPAV